MKWIELEIWLGGMLAGIGVLFGLGTIGYLCFKAIQWITINRGG